MTEEKTREPSAERMPFDNAGVLKPEGPGPYPEGFLLAQDVAHLPWARPRGDEWTTAEFRAVVVKWLRLYLRARQPRKLGWRIVEKSTTPGSSRLPEDQHYLAISITMSNGLLGAAVAVPFPVAARPEVYATRILNFAGSALDVQLGIEGVVP